MHYGIMFANAGFIQGPATKTMAQAVERCGFESLWTVEHVVVPAGYESAYPYSRDGRMPGPEESPIPEPLTWLSFVAACTTTLKLATGITILPQRNPLYMAKEAATVDQLSGGRMILGIGAGWLKEEFDALGVPFDDRGARTDEYIAALRELWQSETAQFSGEYVHFDPLYCRPQPAQDSIPIVIGGHSPRAARRAGELGNGFFPGLTNREKLRAVIDQMRSAAEKAGRDPEKIEITATLSREPGYADWAEENGISRLLLPLPSFDPNQVEERLEETAAALGVSPA